MDFRPWLRTQFSPAQLTEARQNFCGARHLIETHGWTRMWYRLEVGHFDLARAIHGAAGICGVPHFDNSAVIAESIFTRHVGMNIFTWNDEHARNTAHVIETLDGLIAILTEETQHGSADTDQEDEAQHGRSSDHIGAH